jgi:hypothetical protein
LFFICSLYRYITVDATAAGPDGGTTVLSSNGTVARIHNTLTVVPSGDEGGPKDTGGGGAVSVLPEGSLEASVVGAVQLLNLLAVRLVHLVSRLGAIAPVCPSLLTPHSLTAPGFNP